MRQLFILALALMTGCAGFSTTQKDVSYTFEFEKGQSLEVRQITTRATARAFFDAKSVLAGYKAIQTDKTQSAIIGGLNQEVTATNLVQLLEKAAKLAREIKSPVPLP